MDRSGLFSHWNLILDLIVIVEEDNNLVKAAVIVIKRVLFVLLVLLVVSGQSMSVLASDDPAGGNMIELQLMDTGEYHRLINRMEGYSLLVPAGMQAESAPGGLGVILTGNGARIEIFHEKFNDISVGEYVTYSSQPIRDGRDRVRVLKDEVSQVQDVKIYQLWWEREKLPVIPEDMNYYAVVHIKTGTREVFTLKIKAAGYEWLSYYVPTIVESFRRDEVQQSLSPAGMSTGDLSGTQSKRKYALSPVAANFLTREFSATQRWGLYEPEAPESFRSLESLEEYLQYRFDYLLVYSNLDSPLPKERLEKAKEEGRYLEYTLQTLLTGHNQESVMYDLLQGRYDEQLRAYARSMAAFNGPVLFRLNNEMNGDWCGYSAYYSSLDPEIYTAFWRYLFQLFHEEGADNVLWVWNPNDRSFPDFKWNHALMYYPGDEYVDIIGLTGYNTGNYYPGEVWRSFAEIYDPLYAAYMQWFPEKPFMITEFGANSRGGDKPGWILDAFVRMKRYPNIKVAVWWNSIDWDNLTKARIYRLEDDASLEAFKEGLKHYSKHR